MRPHRDWGHSSGEQPHRAGWLGAMGTQPRSRSHLMPCVLSGGSCGHSTPPFCVRRAGACGHSAVGTQPPTVTPCRGVGLRDAARCPQPGLGPLKCHSERTEVAPAPLSPRLSFPPCHGCAHSLPAAVGLSVIRASPACAPSPPAPKCEPSTHGYMQGTACVPACTAPHHNTAPRAPCVCVHVCAHVCEQGTALLPGARGPFLQAGWAPLLHQAALGGGVVGGPARSSPAVLCSQGLCQLGLCPVGM